MATFRFFGHHVSKPGRPEVFRTLSGAQASVHAPGLGIESLFSRKSETINLDAVKQQHSTVAATFDAMENSSIHITNNTDHIERLNDGWSAQTSPGFFERALLVAKRSVLGTWKLKVLP